MDNLTASTTPASQRRDNQTTLDAIERQDARQEARKGENAKVSEQATPAAEALEEVRRIIAADIGIDSKLDALRGLVRRTRKTTVQESVRADRARAKKAAARRLLIRGRLF